MKQLTVHNPMNLHGVFTITVVGQDPIDWGADRRVRLVDPQGQELGFVMTRDCWSGDLAQIPASVLEIEQNPANRTYSGLILSLRLCGAQGLGPDSKVTSVIVERVEKGLVEA